MESFLWVRSLILSYDSYFADAITSQIYQVEAAELLGLRIRQLVLPPANVPSQWLRLLSEEAEEVLQPRTHQLALPPVNASTPCFRLLKMAVALERLLSLFARAEDR